LLSRTSAHIALVIAACLALLLSTIRVPAWAARSLTSAADLFARQNTTQNTQANLSLVAARNGRAIKPDPWAPIALRADPHTEIPKRPRLGIITYTVQLGDTVQGIAAQFDLEPTTIMWANPAVEDAPDLLRIVQELIILPVDGVYHTVKEG